MAQPMICDVCTTRYADLIVSSVHNGDTLAVCNGCMGQVASGLVGDVASGPATEGEVDAQPSTRPAEDAPAPSTPPLSGSSASPDGGGATPTAAGNGPDGGDTGRETLITTDENGATVDPDTPPLPLGADDDEGEAF